ncbi:MAG: hypothetical protein KGL39_20555 [Patescibacteria group bacterium]|nr:hypothetical protein [Patescibacteria group bacterium]
MLSAKETVALMSRDSAKGWSDQELADIVEACNYVCVFLHELGPNYHFAMTAVGDERLCFTRMQEARKQKV